MPRAEAKAFGCIDSDETGRITEFLEKPRDPPSVPDDPEVTFASMGNYVFTTDALLEALRADAEDGDSDHDMGGDIIPRLVGEGDAHVYDFADNDVPGATDRDAGYWRDVGTIDAYYEAHIDLVSRCTRSSTCTTSAGRSARPRRRCRRPSSSRAASRRTRSSARARSSPGRSCAAR